jgi:hypothetical protein
VAREQSQSVRNNARSAARNNNDEGGATGSTTPTYAQPQADGLQRKNYKLSNPDADGFRVSITFGPKIAAMA